MRRLLLYTLILCIASSCKRDDDSAEPVPAGGGWNTGGVAVKASYSELDTRKGYYLRFSDSLNANTISFLFRTRPEASAGYTPAADTSKFSNVVLKLERQGIGYHSIDGSNGEIKASLSRGKLYLSGSAIRLMPDLSGNPELSVDFSLREF